MSAIARAGQHTHMIGVVLFDEYGLILFIKHLAFYQRCLYNRTCTIYRYYADEEDFEFMKLTKKELFSIPNLMGYARILLLVPILILYIGSKSDMHDYAAGILFLISAVLDWLDGKIARRFHMVTDLGKMLDPISDKMTQAAVAICLATRYPLMISLLALMAVKEGYMAIRGVRHLAKGGAVYGASFWGKCCTATLFLTFSVLLLLPTMSLLYVNLLILISMVVMVITLCLYIRHFSVERKRVKLSESQEQRRNAPTLFQALRRVFGSAVALFLMATAVTALFIVIGAVAPFVRQKPISQSTVEKFSVEEILQGSSAGERVMLLEKNSDALAHRIRLLAGAEERIIISTFDIREGKAIRDMAALLLERAEAGVQVMILGDAFSIELHMAEHPLLAMLTSHENIEMRLYNPVNALTPWTSQGRMHDKYVIVDDDAYIIGGRNTFDYFLLDEGDHVSHDRELLVWQTQDNEASSIHALEEYFDALWNHSDVVPYMEDASLVHQEEVQQEFAAAKQRYEIMKAGEYADCFEKYDYVAVTDPTDSISLLSNPTHIYGKEPTLFYQLTELMKRANERVSIHTPYAVLDDYMQKRIKEVVEAQPHVSVTLMLNGIENGDNVVASSDYVYRKSQVLSTGVRLLEYQGGTSYHGKSVLIDDDISIVGSFNFDMRSTYMDTELMLVVRSRELNRRLSAEFSVYEADACLQHTDGTQTVPADIKIPEMRLGKKIFYQFFGLLLQPFRYLA